MARILILEDENTSRTALVKMVKNISAEITVDAAADLAKAIGRCPEKKWF